MILGLIFSSSSVGNIAGNTVNKEVWFFLPGQWGAGKTTTMYQLARQLLSKQIVLTIEDPAEIDHPGFYPIQAKMN